MYRSNFCTTTPKSFESEDSLSMHECYTNHESVFRNSDGIRSDQESIETPHSLWSCGSLPGIQLTFFTARSTHGYNEGICGFCGTSFPNPPRWAEREKHVNMWHGPCEMVRSFSTSAEFREHLRRSHNGIEGGWMQYLVGFCMSRDDSEPTKEDLVIPSQTDEYVRHECTGTTAPYCPTMDYLPFMNGSDEDWQLDGPLRDPPPSDSVSIYPTTEQEGFMSSSNVWPDLDALLNDDFVSTWLPREQIDTEWDSTSTDISRDSSVFSFKSATSAVPADIKRGQRIPGGYPCPIPNCKAIFDIPSDLKHHKRCHQTKAERPYSCDFCESRFTYPKDLRRHCKAKHPAIPETSKMDPPRKRQRLYNPSTEQDTSSDELDTSSDEVDTSSDESTEWDDSDSERTPTQASYANRTKVAAPHLQSAQSAMNSSTNPDYQTSSVRIAKECLQTIGGFLKLGNGKDSDSEVTATASALQHLTKKLDQM